MIYQAAFPRAQGMWVLFGFLLPQGLRFNITFPLIYMRTFPNSKLPIN